jgi:pectinesterase
LSPSDADRYTALAYLAQAGSLATGLVTDNWDPTPGLGDPTSFTPTYAVAADGGPYPTVQAAIDAATSRDGGSDRVYIFVSPGTYRELVCVPANAPPITLYGMDPVTTVIAYDHFNGQSTDSGAQNPCTATTNATLGTAGSATFAAFANDFQASNITFSNDVTVTTLGTTTGTQGVALMTRADKIVLDHVRVTGHQDTLYVETPNAGTVVRVYVRDSYVAGDVDFIFGGATTVLDGTEVHLVADRRTSGDAVSPDTDARNPYGMLIVQGTFSADANAAAGGFALGRAWDRSCVDIPTYLSTCVSTGQYPNGQAVIRDSMLGGPVAAAPWLPAATTKRPFCNTSWVCSADGGSAEADVCPANRLYEYLNTGPGSAH